MFGLSLRAQLMVFAKIAAIIGRDPPLSSPLVQPDIRNGILMDRAPLSHKRLCTGKHCDGVATARKYVLHIHGGEYLVNQDGWDTDERGTSLAFLFLCIHWLNWPINQKDLSQTVEKVQSHWWRTKLSTFWVSDHWLFEPDFFFEISITGWSQYSHWWHKMDTLALMDPKQCYSISNTVVLDHN